jgi:hypothetical protein
VKTLDSSHRYAQIIRSALLLALSTTDPRELTQSKTIEPRHSARQTSDASPRLSIQLRPGDQPISPYTRAMLQLVLGMSPTPVPRISATTRVVDGLGHAREAYRGIARFVAHLIEPKPTHADPCNASNHHATLDLPIRAPKAASATEAIWDAVLRNNPDERRRFVDTIIRGRFVRFDATDNPEPLWYHELILLHAAATWAHQSGDERLQHAVSEASAYVVSEVQPDHASGQPWAIHALLGHPEGWTLVDLMLHAAGIQQPATMDEVSLLLLADAYRCLQLPA